MDIRMNARQQLLSAARVRGWEPLVWLVAFVLPFALPGHALIVNEVAIVALFAVSLDLVLGYTGIVSLGHAAFLGLGAYASALFAKHVMPDPLVGLLFGMACATLLAPNASRGCWAARAHSRRPMWARCSLRVTSNSTALGNP